MVIRRTDSLAKITGETSTDDRFTNWLWLTLKTRPFTEDPGEFNAPNMRDRMAEIISNNPLLASDINREKNTALVDDRYLSWIKDSRRQHSWIRSRMTNINQLHQKQLHATLNHRELSILTIDVLDNFSMPKNSLLVDLRSHWEQQEKEDRTFDWFQSEAEEDKCGFAWDFLRKKYFTLSLMEEKFRNLDDLLAYVYTHNPSKELIELLISNAKSRWSQKKYRSKQDGKKQYNFILSENAIKRLDKLAEKYDLKRPQIIEILLQMEAEEGAYLPKKIKVLMNS